MRYLIFGLSVGFGLGLGLGSGLDPAIAQITLNSSGIVSGTVVPPSKNPNFNRGTTRINTNDQGQYFRQGNWVYTAPDPNLVRMDANGQYFVDFRGIPVVGIAGSLTSPILSEGDLVSRQCCDHNGQVLFFGTIQDEFVVRGFYAGIATDPKTGQQYQGTFEFRGQGPRYSDKTGGTSPTVFDFQSHYNFQADPQLPPQPTVFSHTFEGMPVKLTVIIPQGLDPISPPPVTPPPVTPPPVIPPVTPLVTPPPVTPSPVTVTPPSLPPSPILTQLPLTPTPSPPTPSPNLPLPTPSSSPPNPTPEINAIVGAIATENSTAISRVVLEDHAHGLSPSNRIGPRSRVMLW